VTASTYEVGSRRTFTPPVVVASGGLVALALLTVLTNHAIRLFEARLSASVLRLIGTHGVDTLGPNVLFMAKHHFVGFTLDAGCSAAFLMAPFLLLGAGMLLTGRVSLRRGLASTAVVVVLVFLANQARLLVIAVAIRGWGLQKGYERSHVFLGTVVSTVGVLVGVLLYFTIVSRGDLAKRGHQSKRGPSASARGDG
jgi:exosortase/archaeosortase family protein